MTFKEIFEKFEQSGSYIFSTINNGYPDSRIAHFVAYDDAGLYFETMHVKPFYKQIKEQGKIAVCALPETKVVYLDGNPKWKPSVVIRVKGDVREISLEELKKKKEKEDKEGKSKKFSFLLQEMKDYPAFHIFCLYKGDGELYDFDFEKEKRDYKLERTRFGFGGGIFVQSGLRIESEKCIRCGQCAEVCTFDAIIVPSGEEAYSINPHRCDECGNCYEICPVGAVTGKGK